MAHLTHLILINDTLIHLVIFISYLGVTLFPPSPFTSYIQPIVNPKLVYLQNNISLFSHCLCCYSYLSYLHLLPRYYNILLPVLQD